MEEYTLKPPPWRSALRNAKPPEALVSGYPDLYETFPGQEEDRLTASNVREGFSGKGHVQSETFSAHGMIYEKLHKQQILPQLSQLVGNVERVRDTLLGGVGCARRTRDYRTNKDEYRPSTFEGPGRTTLTQAKLDAWVNDLANPDVPLSKLAKNSLPRGYAGDKLLDLLTLRKVALERAIWYIRATGASEIRSGAQQDGQRVETYTQQWTMVVCDYFRRLLNEIVLPSTVASAARVSIKGKVRATLTDPALRQNWGSRFGYLALLVRRLYSEGLLSPRHFLEWQLTQLKSVHFGQLPFVLHLIEAYLDEHLESGQTSKVVIEHCLSRLKEMGTDPQDALLDGIRHSIRHLLESFMALRPAAFVQPMIWLTSAAEVHSCFDRPLLRPSMQKDEAQALERRLELNMEECAKRSHLLLAGQSSASDASIESSSLQLIQVLDSIRFPASLQERSETFFAIAGLSIEERIVLLLAWGTTLTRESAWQPSVVAGVLHRHYCGLQVAERRALQPQLEEWLSTPAASANARRTVRLFNELIRYGLFSYNSYYDSMVASGETERDSGKRPGLHQRLIRCLQHQPLHGSRDRLISSRFEVQDREAAILVDIRKALPILVAESAAHHHASATLGLVRSLESAGARSQVSNAVEQIMATSAMPSDQAWVNVVAILEALQDYQALLELCSDYATRILEPPQVLLLADTVSIFIDSWTALDHLDDLILALSGVQSRLLPLGKWPVSAANLLIELETSGRSLHEAYSEQSGAVLDHLPSPSAATTDEPPDIVATMQALAKEPLTADVNLVVQKLHQVASTRTSEWLEAFLEPALDLIEARPDLVPPLCQVFAALKEMPGCEFSPRFVCALWRRHRSIIDSASDLLSRLVRPNIISISLVMAGFVLPMLNSSLRDLLDPSENHLAAFRMAAGATEIMAAFRDSAGEGQIAPADLSMRARWRCVEHQAAFLHLVGIVAHLGACALLADSVQVTGAKDCSATTRTEMEALMKMPMFRSGFLRWGKRSFGTFVQATSLCSTSIKLMQLDLLAQWACSLSTGLQDSSSSAISLEAWSQLPSEIAKWHLDLIRLHVQIHLQKTALREGEASGEDKFLQRLMLDLDPSLTQGLLDSFSSKSSESLFEALCIRTCIGMGDLETVDAQDWARMLSLGDQLLRCRDTAISRHLVPALPVLSTLIAHILETVQSEPEANNDGRVERSLHAFCMALRCRNIFAEELTSDLRALGLILVKRAIVRRFAAQRSTLTVQQAMCNAPISAPGLLELVEDTLSFYLDTFGPSSLMWQAACATLQALPTSSASANILWLLHQTPSVIEVGPHDLSAWDMYDVSPLPGVNTTTIDLALLDGSLVATGRLARQKADHTPVWINYIGNEQGVQARFDSEWPFSRESITSRDFRRGILDEPPPVRTPTPTPVPVLETKTADVVEPEASRVSLKRKATDDLKSASRTQSSAAKGANRR